MMAMVRTYSRAKHQTAAVILFQSGQPQLLVFGVRLGVFAGLHLSAVIPGEAKNWNTLPIVWFPDPEPDPDTDTD